MKSLLALLLIMQHLSIAENLNVTLNGKQIATVERSDFRVPILGKDVIDLDKFYLFIKKIEEETYQEPTNATIDNKGQIVAGENGYTLHRAEFINRFYTYFFSNGEKTIEVPKRISHPKVDSELLSRIHEKQIGQFSTYFNPQNKERTHNITLATEAINNHVIFPGETFSFNEVVGKRTKEKGYLPAPVIVKGEISEGIGGGICQVSSTLFNAVDRAGLKLIKRYTHSKQVPYVPPGRDVAVSWYGPDFIFKNKYNQPILIRSKAYEGKLIITILSSEVINHKPRVIPNQ